MESGVYENITSWDDLAAIPTITIINPVIVIWVEAANGLHHVSQLRMSAATTDRPNGTQRPNDFLATSPKCWLGS